MRPISQQVNEVLNKKKQICARHKEGTCKGRLTREHTLIYAGKQIDEAWAIIFLCAYHHAVDQYQDCGDLQKEKNVWYALNKATDEELLKYSKVVNYLEMKNRLNKKYAI